MCTVIRIIELFPQLLCQNIQSDPRFFLRVTKTVSIVVAELITVVVRIVCVFLDGDVRESLCLTAGRKFIGEIPCTSFNSPGFEFALLRWMRFLSL